MLKNIMMGVFCLSSALGFANNGALRAETVDQSSNPLHAQITVKLVPGSIIFGGNGIRSYAKVESGTVTIGQRQLDVQADGSVWFHHDTGAVRKLFIKSNQALFVGSDIFNFSGRTYLQFSRNGDLVYAHCNSDLNIHSSCTNSSFSLAGTRLTKFSSLAFSLAGKLMSASQVDAVAVEIGNNEFQLSEASNRIETNEGGQVSGLVGVVFPEVTDLSLNNRVYSVTGSDNELFTVTFSESGNVRSVDSNTPNGGGYYSQQIMTMLQSKRMAFSSVASLSDGIAKLQVHPLSGTESLLSASKRLVFVSADDTFCVNTFDLIVNCP